MNIVEFLRTAFFYETPVVAASTLTPNPLFHNVFFCVSMGTSENQRLLMFLEGMKTEYWEIKWINTEYSGSFDIQST